MAINFAAVDAYFSISGVFIFLAKIGAMTAINPKLRIIPATIRFEDAKHNNKAQIWIVIFSFLLCKRIRSNSRPGYPSDLVPQMSFATFTPPNSHKDRRARVP